MQGHVNNALYYGFVDDAINRHLLAHAVDAQYARFVAASSCRYVAPLSYPDDLDVGMRVTKIGSSSATYEVGIFRGADVVDQDEVAAAVVDWVHVYVDAESGRPSPFDDKVRAVLTSLVTE
jgi:acyl-CoA thioester hydrolase